MYILFNRYSSILASTMSLFVEGEVVVVVVVVAVVVEGHVVSHGRIHSLVDSHQK